jgi:hypothetical protein
MFIGELMGRLLEIAKAASPDLALQAVEVTEPELVSSNPPAASIFQGPWPIASLAAERRLAQPHAKLYPFIGRKVRTPTGTGTLLQVFMDRVTVVLDIELSRCSFFAPEQVEPVSWELPE